MRQVPKPPKSAIYPAISRLEPDSNLGQKGALPVPSASPSGVKFGSAERLPCPRRLSERAKLECLQPSLSGLKFGWSCGREAEGGGLLNRYTVVKPYRGFESLRLRHFSLARC